MPGMDVSFLTGGAGYVSAPAPTNGNGAVVAGSGPQAHISVVALVLIAVAILFTLDKAGFRFAVTAGRR